MGKKKLTTAEAGKGQPTVESYYAVVGKPSENKNEEKSLKTDKEIVLLVGNNDSNNNDCTTIRTIMGLNRTPMDDGKDLELVKTNDKNKEHVENSGEEDENEDGLPNKINSEFNDDQESYFNNETEEATIMGASTEVTNVEVSSTRHNNVKGPNENLGGKSKSNKE